MPWVRLDDKFWRNPKMRRLSHAARGVAVDAMSYCADTPEPTGFLTYHEATQRASGPAGKRLIAELVREVAWEPVSGGYLIHDFEHYLDRGSRERCRRWRERKRSEGVVGDVTVAQNERHQGVTSRDGSGDYKNVRVLPDPVPVPEPVPDGDGAEALTKRRFEIPTRGFKGGEMTSLAQHLPKVAGR